jgi:hypothetical protein
MEFEEKLARIEKRIKEIEESNFDAEIRSQGDHVSNLKAFHESIRREAVGLEPLPVEPKRDE